MKKLFLFIIVLTNLSFGQSWNTIVTTTLSEPNVDKTDLFTNKDGNHLLVKRINGNIIYYNLNSSGVVDANKTITLETTGDFPNIVGSNDKIYALYKSGNFIKGKYSTNAGTNWTALPNDISTTANECNGVDAVWNDQGVHLVWATRDNGSNFETYYYRLRESDFSWVDYKPVTDYSNEVGGQPSITLSTDRIHVIYNTNYYSEPITGSVKSRDKYESSWQTPQNVIVGSEQSALEKIIARGDSLFVVFAKAYIDPYIAKWDICSKKRSISGSTWSNTKLIELNIFQDEFAIGKTANNILHSLYKPGSLNYSFYNGLIWSSPLQINESSIYVNSLNFAAQSNDLYAMWKDGSNNYLKYRQYDAAPFAPTNYSVSAYQSGTNYYPRLTWSLNNEPDVRGNSTDAYKIERRTRPLNGNWSSWSELANLSGTTSSYIDYTINNASGGDREAEYRITAKDIGDNTSSTQSVIIEYGQNILDKMKINGMVSNYALDQNYPNPFNPATKISYSIKEEGLVTLKVYDVLGKEVATLVNENKAVGNYEVDFNASQLPSGMYIYKIQSGNFSDVKKMLLMK